jgi:hypothetical protein
MSLLEPQKSSLNQYSVHNIQQGTITGQFLYKPKLNHASAIISLIISTSKGLQQ